MQFVTELVAVIALVFIVVSNLVFAAFTLIAWRTLLNYRRSRESATVDNVFRSPLTPPVSVLIPAFNEEAGIVESVTSLLQLRYPEFEIIVIDDGSTDSTWGVLDSAFDLVDVRRVMAGWLPTKPVTRISVSRKNPSLTVVSKENGGKADALNTGLNIAKYPYFCAIDADAVLEEEALLRAMVPIIENPEVVATGGIVRIANGCEISHGRVIKVGLPRKTLPLFQVIEYLRAFLVGRVGWSSIGALMIVSGAFGIFHRKTVLELGGYWTDTVGEDMELIVRIHREKRAEGVPYKVAFVPDPVCWTEAPSSVRILGRQRRRWQRGLMEAVYRHRAAIFEPRQGVFGRFAMPFFLVIECWGPVFELFGYVIVPVAWLLGVLAVEFMIALLILSIAWGVLLSVSAIALEEFGFRKYPLRRQVIRLTVFSILDNFGYRQITNLWRVQGILQWLRGEKSWGTMTRQGFSQDSRKAKA